MIVRQVIQAVRRHIPFARSAYYRPIPPLRSSHEFRQVNAVAGRRPLKPALSGLRIRYPFSAPQRTSRRRSDGPAATDMDCRWRPSAEYWRRRKELVEMNRWLREQPRRLSTLPPILFYGEEYEISPRRFQPTLDLEKQEDSVLAAGDEVVRLHAVRIIRPRLPGFNGEDLLVSRPLLPRRYREFFRRSLYPKLVLGLIGGAVAAFGILWVTQLQQAEAVAAGQFHLARHAFQAELDAARAYGLDPGVLRPLQLQARRLDAIQAPEGLISRARERFYKERARDYRLLLRTVRRLEQQALHYWAGRESGAYAALAKATDAAHSAGLAIALPSIPACGTPRCYRAAVSGQTARAAWLRQTVATIGVYEAAVLKSLDPVSTAGSALQKARSLSAILPSWAAPPVRIANLDGMYATASNPADDARVGALAHLDADALQADLMRTLPGRAIVVSVEDQKVTLYQRGKAVYQSLVTADIATPTGIFHIQAKEVSIPALYWNRAGTSYRYHYGSLPDWMPFSGPSVRGAPSGSGWVSLQGAPWRGVFGPGSDSVQPAYAPSTPGSVDLPPAAAGFLFGWASVGTEVVVY